MLRRAAMFFGAAFTLVAVLGFVTGGMNMDADPETAPKLLAMFPVNALHNAAHLIFGIWGLVASRSTAAARAYLRISGIGYLLLAVLGALSPNLYGLMPLGGMDIWLHTALGAAMAAIGFMAKDDAAPARA